MIGEYGPWFTRKRSRDVNKCAPRIESVISYRPIFEVDRLLLPGSFRDVPVGYLFVVNTL